MIRTTKLGALTIGIAMAAAGGGAALAAGVTLPFTGDGNTIAGCYSSGGSLKVRTPAEPVCPKGYTPLDWAAKGQAGAAGPTGPTGPAGAAGPAGPAGASQAYRIQSEHVVSSETSEQEIVGLSDLAGSYVFYTTVRQAPYITEGGSFFSRDLQCSIRLNGNPVDLAPLIVGRQLTVTDVVALTVPAGSKFTVGCVLRQGSGFGEDERSLAKARITALKVGSIS